MSDCPSLGCTASVRVLPLHMWTQPGVCSYVKFQRKGNSIMSSLTNMKKMSEISSSVWALATKFTLMLVVTLGVLLFSIPLFSQANFGRILGTVIDQSGGVVAGATVTIVDQDRGVTRSLTTD